jgi:arsenate reductase-like glutaredoxin family protein
VKNKIEPKIIDIANKAALKESDIKKILKEVSKVYARKGKKTVSINLNEEKVSKEIMEKFILGPTGNLRAPIIRKGKALLIGFDEDSYKVVLKK